MKVGSLWIILGRGDNKFYDDAVYTSKEMAEANVVPLENEHCAGMYVKGIDVLNPDIVYCENWERGRE